MCANQPLDGRYSRSWQLCLCHSFFVALIFYCRPCHCYLCCCVVAGWGVTAVASITAQLQFEYFRTFGLKAVSANKVCNIFDVIAAAIMVADPDCLFCLRHLKRYFNRWTYLITSLIVLLALLFLFWLLVMLNWLLSFCCSLFLLRYSCCDCGIAVVVVNLLMLLVMLSLLFCCCCFLKMGQARPLFVYFRSIHMTNTAQIL